MVTDPSRSLSNRDQRLAAEPPAAPTPGPSDGGTAAPHTGAAASHAPPLPDKEFLERQKLQAEFGKIGREVALSRATLRLERFKVAATYGTLVATLLVALTQVGTYLAQQARSHRFAVSKEMNDLVVNLTGGDDKATEEQRKKLQRLAALQMANFGGEVVPLLVESLDIARDDTVTDAIVSGLRYVGTRAAREPVWPLGWVLRWFGGEEREVDVVGPLSETARRVAARELAAPRPSVDAVKTYVRALGALARGRAEWRPPMRETLTDLAVMVERSGAALDRKEIIADAIQQQLAGLAP